MIFMVVAAASNVVLAQDGAVLPAGLSLPTKGGMYAVEVSGSGGALTQLHASEISVNSHAGSNFARSMVYAGSRAGWELKGLNAATHLRGTGLSFLVRLPDDDAELVRGRVTLLRLHQTEKNRVAAGFSQNMFGGQRKRQQDVIEVTKVDVQGGSWLMVTPAKTLEPGEYGLAVLPKDSNVFADAVYDFDVDFNAAKLDETPVKK